MPNTSPDAQFISSPGNTYFSVSVPSSALHSVVFCGDANGQNVLATVAPGGSNSFYCMNGFFAVSPGGASLFTYSASQAFVAGAMLYQAAPGAGQSLLTNSTLGVGTPYFRPFDLQNSLSANHVDFYVSVGTVFSNSNATGSCGVTLNAALYSRGSGASSNNIYSFWSGSAYWQISNSSDTALSITHPVGIASSNAMSSLTTALATSDASKYLATTVGGFRIVPIPISTTLPAGRYWMCVQYSSTSANASFNLSMSILQETYSNQIAYQALGVASSASNVSFPNIHQGLGAYTSKVTAFPGTIALTGGNITGAPVMTAPFFNFSGYTTNASGG